MWIPSLCSYGEILHTTYFVHGTTTSPRACVTPSNGILSLYYLPVACRLSPVACRSSSMPFHHTRPEPAAHSPQPRRPKTKPKDPLSF
ncbi:hypothetical protein BGZ63DRAFT_375238 [Mariannaea sp. PMI_226]|nr:hypothetical protein BGZ63DRAFT_375238 [Mariannaea sp. PMI_226]